MRYLKPLTFTACLIPLAVLAYQVYLTLGPDPGALGADPGEEVVAHLGEWAIRLLVLTLLVTPVRRLTGWISVQPLRRMFGLFAFLYAALHLTAYLVLLLNLDFSAIWADVLKRPYITVGFAGFLLLVPLAVTSTNAMRRRLGRNWVRLHQLVYAVAVLAVLHLAWLAKSSYMEAFVYGAIMAALLGYRLWNRLTS